jgi:hypothetical protein
MQNPYTKSTWSNNANEFGNSTHKKSNLKNRDLPKDNSSRPNKNISSNTNTNLNLNFKNNSTKRNPILHNLMNSSSNNFSNTHNANLNNNNTNSENKAFLSKPNHASDKINSLYNSARCLIVAKAFEMQENKEPAIRNYMEALRYDPGNIEAFEALINHNLFSNEQKLKLTHDLVFDKHNLWLFDYFYSKSMDNIFITEKSECLNSFNLSNVVDSNAKNSDVEDSKVCFLNSKLKIFKKNEYK